MSFTSDIYQLAKNIRCLICDVDGVLTDGSVYLDNQQGEMKAFNIKDGLGIKLMQRGGIETVIITGRNSPVVSRRMAELGIEHYYQGQQDKQAAFEDVLAKLNIQPDNVAYVGDDLPDLPLMKQVGIGFAPADAASFVREKADYLLQTDGGKGAVREIAELLLATQGKLDSIHEEYWSK